MSSLIAIDKKVISGYVLKSGCSWNPKIVNNLKEGPVEVHNKRGRLVAKLQYHYDKLNGLCKFYDNGHLVKEIYYENDVANGSGCEYDEFGDVIKSCYYKNGEKNSELKKNEKREGWFDELDSKSGELISSCLYNEKHERVGKCYSFKNGKINKIVMYENGMGKYCVKEFKEGEMTEYDENGRIVYKGEYFNSDEKEYPRSGQGEVYGEIEDYEGEWKNGKRNGMGTSYRNGVAYYIGMWKDGLPEGKGRLNDKDGRLASKGDNWVKGRLDLGNGEVVEYEGGKKEVKDVYVIVIVRTTGDWKSLNKEVTELVIDESICNDMYSDLVIEELNGLKRILIKKNSLKNLNSLIIRNCKLLEKIETEGSNYEKGSFWNVKSVEISSLFYLHYLI